MTAARRCSDCGSETAYLEELHVIGNCPRCICFTAALDHAYTLRCADQKACAARRNGAYGVSCPPMTYVDSLGRAHLVRVESMRGGTLPIAAHVTIVESLDPRAVGKSLDVPFAELSPRREFDETRKRRDDVGTVALRQANAIVEKLEIARLRRLA